MYCAYLKSKLQRHQPAQVRRIHSAQQGINNLLAMIEAQGIGFAITPKAGFSQQLFFPPAIDAVGAQISPLRILQPIQERITVATLARLVHAVTFHLPGP